MPKPVITLLTDFGSADPYVGIMKGVIAGICPDVVTIDLTHEVQPFQIAQGSFLLLEAWRYFPAGTIHVAVVDPGVGSTRRAILVETGGHFFVGPDNGLFSLVLGERSAGAGIVRGGTVRQLTEERYFRNPVSATFHGRDVFAPVAAHLAAGVPCAEMGPFVSDYMHLGSLFPLQTDRQRWTGAVLHIDRFGNTITNFPSEEFPGALEIRSGLRTVAKRAQRYADMPPGALFVIGGSAGFLEICVNQGSAAKLLGIGLGAPLQLHLL